MATYKVTAVNDPSDSYEIEAEEYAVDPSTHRHEFRDANGKLVASELNVRVRKVS